MARSGSLIVKPYMAPESHGVFSTRAPSRPNNIGLSIVRLVKVEGRILHIMDVDIVAGAPLLDITPYVSKFDNRYNVKIGWLDRNVQKLPYSTDDGRFRT